MLETAIELSRMGPATSPAHEPPQKTEESTHQRKRKVWKLLIRWVWTVIFTTLIFAVAKIYLARGNITKGQKATHNLIQTALILTLGLNIYVSDNSTCTVRHITNAVLGSVRRAETHLANEDRTWGRMGVGQSRTAIDKRC